MASSSSASAPAAGFGLVGSLGPGGSSSAAAVAGSSSSSPCAACKFLRRKCQPDCVFAPYFPPDNPQKFVQVHRVFGASNVTKLLNELPACHREDAVNSLAYEADWRIRDPVYGCVGVISVLQHQLRQLQLDLLRAKSELAKYQQAAAATSSLPNGSAAVLHSPLGFGHEQFFSPAPPQQNGGAAGHVMVRGPYDAEPAMRLGAANGDSYDGSLAGALGFGLLGGQLLKPSTTGGDERPSQV